MPCKLPHYNCSISFYASIISQKFSGASLPNPHHGLHPWLSLGAAPQSSDPCCSLFNGASHHLARILSHSTGLLRSPHRPNCNSYLADAK